MFIKAKEWEKLKGKVEIIADEIKHIKRKGRIKGEIYVQSFCWGNPYWAWAELVNKNIIDEVDGYVKIKIHSHIADAVGLKSIEHMGVGTTIDGPKAEAHYTNTVLWLKKDCIVWHDKDDYAKEKKKIEKKQKKGGKK